jgi:hypothetical protein
VNNSDQYISVLDKLVTIQRESALPAGHLDTFDGSNILEFPSFMKNFQLIVEENTHQAKRRLEMLLKYTHGEAKALIKDCSLIEPQEAAYARALSLLKRDYGHPALLAEANRKKAQEYPRVPSGDKGALKRYATFITNCYTAKMSNDEMTFMDSHEFLRLVASKLPVPIQQRWIAQVGRYREDQSRSATMQDFERFVGQLSRDENDPRIAGLGYQGRTQGKPENNRNRGTRAYATEVKTPPKNQFMNTSTSTKKNMAEQWPCLYCQGPRHSMVDCRKFQTLKAEERSDYFKKKGLCFGCMNQGHMKRNCPNPEWAKCKKCQRSHATALHDPEREKRTNQRDEGRSRNHQREDKSYITKPKEKVNQDTPVSVTTGCVNTNGRPLMTIVPVLVKLKASDMCLATYAFIDDGSGAVFADKELSRRLNIRTKSTKLFLKTLNLEQTQDTEVTYDELQVGSIDGTSFIDLPDIYLRDEIPVSEREIPKQHHLNNWEHLADIDLPKLSSSSCPCLSKVSLLIGMNVPAATTPLETRIGTVGEPYAIRSPLGWLVYGIISKNTEDAVSVHFCSNITTIQQGKESLEELFKDYVSRDFDERFGEETSTSIEDKTFLKLMEESIEQESDGHFKMALPFRNRDSVMPNNRVQAEAYVQRLKKKLLKDEVVHQQ